MTNIELEFHQRKAARPAWSISAALAASVEKGTTAAERADGAKRAGVVKGTLYRYVDTLEQVFQAVVQSALTATLTAIEQAKAAFNGRQSERILMLLSRVADRMGSSCIPAMLRMVLSESRSFPDLARVWNDEVVATAMTNSSLQIGWAQAHGSIHISDPNLSVMSIVGPMVMALFFHEVVGSESPYALDLQKLVVQHAEIILREIM